MKKTPQTSAEVAEKLATIRRIIEKPYLTRKGYAVTPLNALGKGLEDAIRVLQKNVAKGRVPPSWELDEIAITLGIVAECCKQAAKELRAL